MAAGMGNDGIMDESPAARRDRLQSHLVKVRDRMTSACARVGRDPASVQLIAVTKYVPSEILRDLYALGVRDFAESRPQALWERCPLLPPDVRWHLIGHLQTNKIRKTFPLVSMIHSVDSMRLAEELHRETLRVGQTARVMLEANISGETAKTGMEPAELLTQYPKMLELQGLTLVGLMGMARAAPDMQACRPDFAALRGLRDRLRDEYPQGPRLVELSMGMSADYEVAIEEGATMVRVGSALFEG